MRETAGVPDSPASGTQSSILPLMDFTGVKAANAEITAWLVIDGTGIDYPVVQAPDNSYYLTHTAEKKQNKNGALFLDYRVHPDFSDFNNVIYGHNMRSGKMFAALVKFKEKAYFDAHTSGVLYAPGKTYRLEIFAVSIAKADSAHYGYAFVSPAEREAHLQMIQINETRAV